MIRFFGWDVQGNPVRNWTVAVAYGMAEARIFGAASDLQRRRRSIAYDIPVESIRVLLTAGKVPQSASTEILNWCIDYEIQPDEWPSGIIARRLNRICRSNSIAREDLRDLRLLLADLVNDPDRSVCELTDLPFTDPVPCIEFRRREFVLVGDFVFGRGACIQDLCMLGGRAGFAVTSQTDYLVIGALQSCDWNNSPTKAAVDAARAVTAQAGPTARRVTIICEETFLKGLFSPSSAQPVSRSFAWDGNG